MQSCCASSFWVMHFDQHSSFWHSNVVTLTGCLSRQCLRSMGISLVVATYAYTSGHLADNPHQGLPPASGTANQGTGLRASAWHPSEQIKASMAFVCDLMPEQQSISTICSQLLVAKSSQHHVSLVHTLTQSRQEAAPCVQHFALYQWKTLV